MYAYLKTNHDITAYWMELQSSSIMGPSSTVYLTPYLLLLLKHHCSQTEFLKRMKLTWWWTQNILHVFLNIVDLWNTQPWIIRALNCKVTFICWQNSCANNEVILLEIIINYTDFDHLPGFFRPCARYSNFGQLPCVYVGVPQYVGLGVCVWLCLS